MTERMNASTALAEKNIRIAPTRLTDLAARTVSALRAASIGSVRVRVDDTLFSGPWASPTWEGNYVGSSVGPVTALAVDAARSAGGGRQPDPPIATGEACCRKRSASCSHRSDSSSCCRRSRNSSASPSM